MAIFKGTPTAKSARKGGGRGSRKKDKSARCKIKVIAANAARARAKEGGRK
jgi:hypothetical protein